MAALVTLERAKTHLRITDDDHDDDVTQKVAAASAAIVKYLKAQADPTWDADTNPAPAPIVAAVLLMLGYLYDLDRGDSPAAVADVWIGIQNLLVGWRDPALA